MFKVHPLDLEGPAIYGCAQAGCQACLEALILRHEGLVHFVLHRQAPFGMAYNDLAQEGRIALWKAVLGFDPRRGIPFSSYAVPAIERRMWTAIARHRRQQRVPLPSERPDALEDLEEAWQQADIRTALLEAVYRLPDRLREIIMARYGLGGRPRCTVKSIGRRFGISGPRVSQLCNDALVLLRLPAYSGRLRYLCGQDSRAAYARSEALSQAWLQRRRRMKKWRRAS